MNPCYTTIQGAVNEAGTGDKIRIVNGTYLEDVRIDRTVELVLQGGWDSTFTTQILTTVIKSMSISDGTIIAEYLVIREF